MNGCGCGGPTTCACEPGSAPMADDMPLDERLAAIADIIAMTVTDEETADAITNALDAAAAAVSDGDMETAHEALTDATALVSGLADAAEGETKETLDGAAKELGRGMEETAGGILGTRVRRALGR